MDAEAEREAEEARQKVDDQAELVAALVLAKVLGAGDGQGGSSMLVWPAELEKAVAGLAKLVGLAAVISLLRPTGGTAKLEPAQKAKLAEVQDEVAPLVRKIVDHDIVGAARQRQLLVRSGAEPPPDKETAARWAQMIGRTAATRAAAEAAIAMAEPVQRLLETELRKLWISRGDSRVRPLHRLLHGKTEKIGEPFWRELSTGRVLRYPGDPLAPIGQVANCRCHLMLARADEAKDAERVFHLEDSDFALVAAQHPADLSPSAVRDLHAARLVREAESQAVTAAGAPTGIVIVLVPDGLDDIEYKDGDKAPAHTTVAYLGSTDDATEEELEEVRKTAARLAELLPGPVTAKVAGRATLGDEQDEVVLVEAQEIQDLHEAAMSDPTYHRLAAPHAYPHFIPHVTYPHDKAPDEITYSKIGCWIGPEQVEHEL